ncbi:MAG: tRNA threonylcarbamoyladenosine dehydratase [Peptococcaceae bacterium]|nr:tRNA threonylcarbamoyladenosine dehydratase [Peptococcaceae bacterium]
MENFYDRTQRLLGEDAVRKLAQTHIVVVGVGGVGSWASEALARVGVGKLTLVDFDQIEVSNINRQLHALTSTVGQYKVDAMRARLLDINPALEIKTSKEKLSAENIPAIFAQGDFTIDCIDDVRAKVALIAWHLAHDKAIVSSMGTGNKIGRAPFVITDISKTKVCPLARAVRLGLRKQGVYAGVPVLYSEELPYRTVERGEKPGTVCFSPAVAGLQLAQFVVEKILNL